MAEAFLGLAREDQIEALGVAASGSGLSPHMLEKDIWVVWTLNALFSGPEREHLVFKGGTSLSNAYGVIGRFSEDLDVTVDIRHLIHDLAGDGEQPIAATTSQQRRWRKAIDEALSRWVAGVIAPLLEQQAESAELSVRIERSGDKVWIRHDPVSSGWGYMSPDVLIEFGAVRRPASRDQAHRLLRSERTAGSDVSNGSAPRHAHRADLLGEGHGRACLL